MRPWGWVYYWAALSGQRPTIKWRPPNLWRKKTKWRTDQVSRPPSTAFVSNLLIFEGKGWVISEKQKLMVGEQEQYSCVKLLALCYRLEKRKNWSGNKSLRLLSKALFICRSRPLSAYRKSTRIETHFSSITLQRDDRSRLNLVEEGWIFMFENWTMAMLRIHIHKPQ